MSPGTKRVHITFEVNNLMKAPCLYPLESGERCCECSTCQPSSEQEIADQWAAWGRRKLDR